MHVANLFLKVDGTGNLEIGEAVNLGLAKQFLVESVDIALLQALVYVDDMF